MKINRTTLPNGLRLVHCQLSTTQMVAVNVLYQVGSANESCEQTGFAHLFEHLMFGGTSRFPDYDAVLQQAQGENNAYTTWDYTDYYITLPARHLDIALQLEFDRMGGLAFTPRSLEVQRKVVMEEFKQSYLNQPYGDVQHLLARLAFGTPQTDGTYLCQHPYSWPTIGLELQHIADATMPQVKQFFHRFYRPDNAILVVTGDVEWEELKIRTLQTLPPAPPIKGGEWSLPDSHEPSPLPEDHYTPLPSREGQGGGSEGFCGARFLSVLRPVPQSLLLLSFYIPPRTDKDFHACDMLTDVLSNGKSSRLNRRLVEEQRLFLSLDAYVDGRLGTGLLIIEGVPAEDVSMQQAEEAVWGELQKLQDELVPDAELQKQKNKYETNSALQLSDYQRLAEQLAYFEMLGDARLLLDDVTEYQAVTAERLQEVASRIFDRSNACVLHYLCSDNAT